MKAPYATVNELAFLLGRTRLANLGFGENPVATIEPAIRPPYKAVEGFVPIMDTPAIQKDLGFAIRLIITIGIRYKDQFRRLANVDTPHANGNSGAESKLISEELLLVEYSITINILKDLDAVLFIRGVAPACLVVVVFQGPESSPVIEAGYPFWQWPLPA